MRGCVGLRGVGLLGVRSGRGVSLAWHFLNGSGSLARYVKAVLMRYFAPISVDQCKPPRSGTVLELTH